MGIYVQKQPKREPQGRGQVVDGGHTAAYLEVYTAAKLLQVGQEKTTKALLNWRKVVDFVPFQKIIVAMSEAKSGC